MLFVFIITGFLIYRAIFEQNTMAISQGDVKTYKRRFDRELRHLKVILAHERHRIPTEEWRRLVRATKASIIESPEEFFCTELPPQLVFLAVIEKVFDGFLEDQRLLSIQKSNVFWKRGR